MRSLFRWGSFQSSMAISGHLKILQRKKNLLTVVGRLFNCRPRTGSRLSLKGWNQSRTKEYISNEIWYLRISRQSRNPSGDSIASMSVSRSAESTPFNPDSSNLSLTCFWTSSTLSMVNLRAKKQLLTSWIHVFCRKIVPGWLSLVLHHVNFKKFIRVHASG